MTEEVVDKRVKEKQVKVLRDLVTVNRESEPKVPLGNREGGKDNDLVSQETCLMLVRGYYPGSRVIDCTDHLFPRSFYILM